MAYKKTGQFLAEHMTVADFLKQYAITDFTFLKAPTGIENTTLIITTKINKYILRIYRYGHKKEDEILLELGFMHKLRSAKLPVPEVILNTSNKLITTRTENGLVWHAILMEFISGHHADNYSPGIIKEFAMNQAKMHLIGIEAASELFPPSKISQLKETEFIHLLPSSSMTNQKIRKLIERARDYRLEFSDKLSFGYSHFDYDIENTLVDDDNHLKAILDFDDLQYAPVVMCLAYTLWHVLIVTDSPESVRRYINAYESIRSLSNEEKKIIPSIMLFRHYVLASLTLLRGELDAQLDYYLRLEKFIQTVKY